MRTALDMYKQVANQHKYDSVREIYFKYHNLIKLSNSECVFGNEIKDILKLVEEEYKIRNSDSTDIL